jgi:hypothetical protein
VPPAVDAQPDADVLAGLVVGGETPARLDGDRGGVRRLVADVDDFAAKLSRRPQRVEQFEIVVG